MSGLDDRDVMPGFATIPEEPTDAETSGDIGNSITVDTLWRELKRKEAQYAALVQLHAQLEVTKQKATRDAKIARYTVMALVTLVFLVFADPKGVRLQDLLKIFL